ncbi:A/G-specific adenine glycosylase [Ramlibacter sp.]|uniref:A/G-specific adenine glycosylase n=1 Tax=Ramlibacter sp. TaxID=1917967 RepID=UPI002C8C80EA|nr:A/G-specific adenine glycosylase [Ramlibacter sp.]HWI83855.1 A/G-specific adenine glycosylase [Ramlibacter sp.]
MTALPAGFAGRIVRWQQSHGRQGLPWQATRDPYRVWLSEIMLQQTQVARVLDYYPRFLARFPDVRALAAGALDEVYACWSGLGYYSRARNLHRCAQEVMARHGGEFPRRPELLEALPGIGRSTAAAIASFCFGERAAILDGNVKRVLTRVLGFDADLAVAGNERQLWGYAQELLPRRDLQCCMPAYTQGLMDLGATICLPRNPSCLLCPAASACVARRQGTPEHYPVKTRQLRRGSQSLWLLRAATDEGAVWLEKRPPRGIWAGLYCLPVFGSADELGAALDGHEQRDWREAPPFLHVLTHKDLYLHSVAVRVRPEALQRRDGAWMSPAQFGQIGLPAPVQRLLLQD